MAHPDDQPRVHVHDTAADTGHGTLPLYTRVGWGMGGIADNFMANTLFVLGMVIYTTAFKMPAVVAGLALFVPRLADAITDPWIGNISDNLRTRFGRRRPMMVIGVIGSAILLPLMWFPPMMETVGNPWYSNGPFWYLAILGSIYFIFYTLFMVPYAALGFELTDNYDARTRVLAWRMYLGLFASMSVYSLYWLCLRPIFGEGTAGEINGARWVSLGLAVIILITGLIPVLTTRERTDVAIQPTTPIIPAVKYTLSNKPFLILFIAYIAIIMGIFTAGTVGTFALIYYVFQNAVDIPAAKDHASLLGMISGVLAALVSYGSMYLAASVSRLTGKRTAMLLGLILMLIGTLAVWVFYNPDATINRPDWVPVTWIAGIVDAIGGIFVADFTVDRSAIKLGVLICIGISAMGGQGCWLMVDSMTADICDEDELKTGRRREGMFSAAQGFGRKIAFAIVSLMGGFLIQWTGFDADQAEAAGGVSDIVGKRMLLTFMLCQGGGLVIAIAIFFFYPISRARAEATRAELERRRGDAGIDHT